MYDAFLKDIGNVIISKPTIERQKMKMVARPTMTVSKNFMNIKKQQTFRKTAK